MSLRWGVTTFGATLGACAASAGAGLLDPSLDAVLREVDAGRHVPALVHLVDRVDLASVRGPADVIRALRELATLTQADLRADLDARRAAGTVRAVRPFWIANVIGVEATPSALRAIAARPDVDMVYLDHPLAARARHRRAGPQRLVAG